MSSSTWTRQRVFNPKTIQKSTNVSLHAKLRLLFKRNRYATEWDRRVIVTIRYKELGGKAYILNVRRWVK